VVTWTNPAVIEWMCFDARNVVVKSANPEECQPPPAARACVPFFQ
jgi:hypothetical protein